MALIPNLRPSGADFTLYSQIDITNTGATTIIGDIGYVPPGSYTGSGTVTQTGNVYTEGAFWLFAQSDFADVAADISALTGGTAINSAAVTNHTLTAGYYHAAATVILTGVLTLSGSATDQFIFNITGDFDLSTGSSMVLSGGAVANNVYFLTSGGAIFTDVGPYFGNFIGTTTTDIGAGADITGRFFNAEGIIMDGDDITNPGPYPVAPCYVEGTEILVDSHYYKKIEDLKEGDSIITFGKINEFNGMSKKEIIKSVKCIGFSSKGNEPICIQKDTFSIGVPFVDTYVSPDHCLFINGKLVLARNLINGISIYQDLTMIRSKYYHIELENHSIVVANGLLAESYLRALPKHNHEYDQEQLSFISSVLNRSLVRAN